MTREILDFLKVNDVKYKENFKLSLISPIKIGGIAKLIIYPDNKNKLIDVVDFLENRKIKYKILGRMSNVLLPDTEFNDIIIKTDELSFLEFHGTVVEAGAGITLPLLAKITADMGLSGLEELSGIPGSLGGAIRGNAGAYGREISDLVSQVTVYNFRTSSIECLKVDKIKFDYRFSSLVDADVILLSAKLSLARSDKIYANSLIQTYRERRTATQPVGLPSLGSTFKRPENEISASKLIDECGLKGKRVGGAKISEKHAGFIVNVGGATAEDYLELSDIAKDMVYQKFGISLEKEIEVI